MDPSELAFRIIPIGLTFLGGVWWMATLASRVKSLETRLNTLEAQLIGIHQKMGTLEGMMIRLETKVDILINLKEKE